MKKRTLVIISTLGVLIIGTIGYLGYWKYQFKKHPDKLKVIEGTTIMARSVFENEEDLTKAEEIFKEALEINPNNVDAYLELGFIYRVRKMFKEAEDYYKKAIELDPNSAEAYYNLGRCYYVQERYDEATEMFNKTLRIKPKHELAQKGLNRIESRKRRERQVEQALLELEGVKKPKWEERKLINVPTEQEMEEIKKWHEGKEEREKERKKRMKKSGITEEDLIQEAMKDGMTREEAEELFLK